MLARTVADLRGRYAGRTYLFDRFSYGDIIVCSLLQAVSPVADRYIRLGPAWRRAWTLPELARQFEDFLAWRDELYARHRKDRVKPALLTR